MRFARLGLLGGIAACAVAAGLGSRALAEDAPQPRADLDVRCIVTPARAEVGATVEAVITATNRGDVASGPLKVEVTVPEGLRLVEDLPMPVDAGPVGAGASAHVRVKLRTLSAGAFTLLWAAQTSAADRTEGGSPIDVTAGGSLQTTIVCRPTSVAVGGRYEVEVDLMNGTAGPVRNLIVALMWPEGVRPRTLGTAKVPEMPAGRSDKFIFEGIAQRAGTLHHAVKVTGDGIPDASLAADLTVTGSAAPTPPVPATPTAPGYDVAIEAPTRLSVGESGSVRVKVTRRGAPGSGGRETPPPMRVALSLASELDFVVTPAPGATAPATSPRKTTTGNFSLKPGESITFENRVKASKAPASHQAALDATVERVSDGVEQGKGTRAISVP